MVFRRSEREMRVLILAPIGRDALLLARTIEQLEVETAIAADAPMLLQMMGEGAGAIIVADEAINNDNLCQIEQWLRTQPPWSDPPFLILTSKGQASVPSSQRVHEFPLLGNFTLIERPMRPETILSSVRAALRGRMKQYEIRSQQQALLQANADLEQFAHSASHDLREPLRNISIYSELLLRDYSKALDERGISFLQLVRESSKRMEQLLADLLAYAQVSNIPETMPEPIPAAKPLEAALANLAVSIRETDTRITIGDLPCVRVREIHLSQLFQNLIGNAIKYRREGVAPELCVSSRPLTEGWLFSVADNGIGINPEYQESVFGLFKRLHRNSEYSGTGMGLAICQRIVERYRGKIWVESKPGSGSTFFFTIPG